MAIEWPSRVIMRNGVEAVYQGRCPITGKHKLFDETTKSKPTTWLLDDDGKCRGDKAPSPQDFASAA